MSFDTGYYGKDVKIKILLLRGFFLSKGTFSKKYHGLSILQKLTGMINKPVNIVSFEFLTHFRARILRFSVLFRMLIDNIILNMHVIPDKFVTKHL